jgi:hypothetical protein
MAGQVAVLSSCRREQSTAFSAAYRYSVTLIVGGRLRQAIFAFQAMFDMARAKCLRPLSEPPSSSSATCSSSRSST